MLESISLQFYTISHIITGVVAIILGTIVLKRNHKNLVHIRFFFLALAVALWSISYSIWLLSNDAGTALFWSRTLNLGATLIPVFYFHWITSVLGIKNLRPLFLYYTITAIFALFSYTDYYIYDVRPVLQFPYWPQMSWLYKSFLIVGWGVMISHGFVLLWKEYARSYGQRREQIKYIMFGSAIGFIGGSTNFPLMVGSSLIPPIGSPLVIAYPIIFSYAIVKHRLMDIKVVLRKSYVFISSFATVFIIMILARAMATFYAESYSYIIDPLILVGVLLLYPKVQESYYALANKYFFSSLYDTKKVIMDLSARLRSSIDLTKVSNWILETISGTFHSTTVAILKYDPEQKKYKAISYYGFDDTKERQFLTSLFLQEQYVNKGKVIVVDELIREGRKSDDRVLLILQKYKIDIVAPLNIKDKVIGIIALGPKETKESYNNEDLRLLELIATQAAIAMENALLYEETRIFNIRLKREIKKATAELEKANEELKKLDEAKSDFISIASHQLRTPLTVIKGYVSMMLEGNFGRINIDAENALSKVYESNERLIRLVENLLNISRIEAGRLTYIYDKNVDVRSIAQSVCQELSQYAKEKKLKLLCVEGSQPLPLVTADAQKLRQVLLNLVDNALKYTRSGTVQVDVRQKDENIVCTVKDTGTGFSPAEKRDLFKRFSRGKRISLVYTEGTGLGLYVAKIIIKEHGGKVWAESPGPGKGSTFGFQIPIRSDPLAANRS